MPQRSSILFWQLLIATIAVDAVVCKWALEASLESVERVYFGLACGQVSAVAIGAFFSSKRSVVRWFWPIAAVAAATGITVWLMYEPIASFNVLAGIYVSLWTLQVLSVLAGLWILGRTSFGDRWRSPESPARIQFATKHLLAAMTVVAVLLVACRLAEFDDVGVVLVMWSTNNMALAIAAVLCHSLRLHFVLRWAAFAGFVVFLTYALTFLVNGDGNGGEAAGINASQALILFLWLTIGGIGPQRTRDIVAESATGSPLESST